jgi:hypothetical protein
MEVTDVLNSKSIAGINPQQNEGRDQHVRHEENWREYLAHEEGCEPYADGTRGPYGCELSGGFQLGARPDDADISRLTELSEILGVTVDDLLATVKPQKSLKNSKPKGSL